MSGCKTCSIIIIRTFVTRAVSANILNLRRRADYIDYIDIRHVPKTTTAVLLRTRLTGFARKLESLPPETEFDEIVRQSRKRFGDSELGSQ